jgi:hypothetical protein
MQIVDHKNMLMNLIRFMFSQMQVVGRQVIMAVRQLIWIVIGPNRHADQFYHSREAPKLAKVVESSQLTGPQIRYQATAVR